MVNAVCIKGEFRTLYYFAICIFLRQESVSTFIAEFQKYSNILHYRHKIYRMNDTSLFYQNVLMCKMAKTFLRIARYTLILSFPRHCFLSRPTPFFPKVYLHTDDRIDVWRNTSGKGGEAVTVIARRLLAKLTVSYESCRPEGRKYLEKEKTS